MKERSALAERFHNLCRDRPGEVAVRLLEEMTSITFAELEADGEALRSAFEEAGLGRGAVIVSLVGNHPIFFPLIAACMEAGAALIPLGEATDAEVVRTVRQAGAQAVVTDRAWSQPVIREKTVHAGLRLLRLADPPDPPNYGASVLLKLTSGSTDLPKAAVASEAHLINDGRHVIEAMGIAKRDVNFACIPLSHSYAIGNLVMPLLWQGSPVALRRSFSPANLIPDLLAADATVFPGVPFMFDRMTQLPHISPLPAGLRLLITAGARIDVDTVSWFRQRANRKVHSFYGSSETGGISYDDTEDVPDPLHVGRPMPETSVEIVSAGADGGPGRVFVRGNAVTAGYAAEAGEESASAFRDGGFLTGDLAYFNPQGWLVVTGRASTLVNVAGRKVDPQEVERTLLELPGIADARVFGMSCERRGQQVVAFVVRADRGLSALAIRRLCAATLSTHKIPRRFVFLERFPLDARGKLDRRALDALAARAEEPGQ